MLDLENEINLPLHNSQEQLSLNDPIIQQMLAGRKMNMNDPTELETINRLMAMLRASKKYKRLSVESANHRWESSIDDFKVEIDPSEYSSGNSERTRRVRFSDSVDVISMPQVSKPSILDKLKNASRKIKNLF